MKKSTDCTTKHEACFKSLKILQINRNTKTVVGQRCFKTVTILETKKL